jgi:hypothetical protein
MRLLNYMMARQGRTSLRYAETMSDRPVVRPGGRLKIDAYLRAPTPDTGALGAERLAPDVHAHRAPGRGALRAGDPLKPKASDCTRLAALPGSIVLAGVTVANAFAFTALPVARLLPSELGRRRDD